MKARMIGTVISREYATRVKKKSFLVTTFLVPVLFAAVCCIPALIMIFNKDEAKTVAVVDESSLVAGALVSNDEITYVDCSACSLDSLKENFFDLDYAVVVHVSPMDARRNLSVVTYSSKPVGMSILDNLKSTVKDVVRDYRIEQYGIPGLKEIMEEVKPEVDIKTFTLKEDGSENIDKTDVYMILSLGLGMIIFLFITMFGSSVLSGVVEEKQSKVVEVLLSSVDAVDLMFGKIIGIALVALTQFVLWIALTAALVAGVFGIVGKDAILGADAVQMVQTMGAGDAAALATDDAAAALATVSAEPNELQEILQTISNINIPELLLYFFLFFVFGYLLYASMFAAIGSAVENVDDSNQLQLPLTVPLMLGYFIALYSWNAPDSALAVWGSMIPFTSPIVMLARIPFGVALWQKLLSLLLLVLTFALMGWLSARIYRVGILTSGKKAGFKDLYKWLKQK